MNKFYEIRNQTDTSADLYFYGDIVSSWVGAWDDTDQYPESIRDFLKEVDGKDLNIYFNSGGGSVFAGMAIYNMLKRHSGTKRGYIDGLAASIVSVIMLACDELYCANGAFVMVHKPWMIAVGNSEDFLKAAEDLEVIEKGMMAVYMDHVNENVTEEQMLKLIEGEGTWLTALEAIEIFDMKLVEDKKAVACISDTLPEYKNIPDDLKNQLNTKLLIKDDENQPNLVQIAKAKLELAEIAI